MLHIKTAVLIITSLVSMLLLSSCSTAQGFGQDLKKLGEEIEKAAE